MSRHRVYTIKTVWNIDIKGDGTSHTEVERRYSHFTWLRQKLVDKFPFQAVPLLPEKDLLEKIYSDDSEHIQGRLKKLQHFLSILVSHPVFHKSDYVKDFLVDSDEYAFQQNFEEETASTPTQTVLEYTKGTYSSIISKVSSILPSFSPTK